MNYEEYIKLKDYSNFASKKIKEQQQEIERLNNIIKEALILTEESRFDNMYAYDDILLPILNKLRESGIRNYIKVEGSDKE